MELTTQYGVRLSSVPAVDPWRSIKRWPRSDSVGSIVLKDYRLTRDHSSTWRLSRFWQVQAQRPAGGPRAGHGRKPDLTS